MTTLRVGKMKVAVVGAGAAGLVAIKHVLDEGFTCEAFEQTDRVGGTWNYTERVGVDHNGLRIHTSMYEGLRTNLPKESMAYPGFPYPKMSESFIHQSQVLEYLNSYADTFNLTNYIKFNSHVLSVKPKGSGWSITVLDTKSKTATTKLFDAVMICVGHYSLPNVPIVKGQDQFRGGTIHSHDYRKSEPYKDKTLLVLGGGPSGIDISRAAASSAKKVYFSYRAAKFKAVYPSNVVHKPPVVEFEENGARFEDGSEEEFDEVIYCTGYLYSFPFLGEECGVRIEDNFVSSLYKHIVNVEHPTMAFIGVTFNCNLFVLFDLQVKFFMAALTRRFRLPSKNEMLEQIATDAKEKAARGLRRKHWHQIGHEYQKGYFDDLSDCAGAPRTPKVLHDLIKFVVDTANRDYRFDVVDDETFRAELIGP